MKTTIKIEPWFNELLDINHTWLASEVAAGRMTADEMQQAFMFTYRAGSKLGVKTV